MVDVDASQFLNGAEQVLLCQFCRRVGGSLQGQNRGGVIRSSFSHCRVRCALERLRVVNRQLDKLGNLWGYLRRVHNLCDAVHIAANHGNRRTHSAVPFWNQILVV